MSEQIITIHTEFIRLDALMKLASLADTGGQAKLLIQAGKVSVNGACCLQRGKKLYGGDSIGIGDTTVKIVAP